MQRLGEQTLPDQDWERVWLDQFHPMRFGRRLWVCPAGQRPAGRSRNTLPVVP